PSSSPGYFSSPAEPFPPFGQPDAPGAAVTLRTHDGGAHGLLLELRSTIFCSQSRPRGGFYVPLGTGPSGLFLLVIPVLTQQSSECRTEAVTLRGDSRGSHQTAECGEALNRIHSSSPKMVASRLRDVSRQKR